jgi:hypothetical protein
MRIKKSKFRSTSKGTNNRRGSHTDLNFRPTWPTESTSSFDEIVMASVSTSSDLRSVVARNYKNKIYYRVIDNENDFVYGPQITRSSKLPLTLGALTNYLLGAFDLFKVLENTLAKEGYALDKVRGSFEASSEFYPEFEKLIDQRVEKWLKRRQRSAR